MERVREFIQTATRFSRTLNYYLDPNAPKYAVVEINQGCNRNCSYCDVPSQYKPQQELTVAQTKVAIDFLKRQGYLHVTFLGGEPFAPFKTKEGITFAEHTLEGVRHASEIGMMVNVTSNGDFLNPQLISSAAEAGLDALTLSLHTYSEPAINQLIKVGRLAARQRIIPAIHTVMTSESADKLPGVAAKAARNGIMFSTGVVQTIGDGYAKEQDASVIPTLDQQERVFRFLRGLKLFGFTRTNFNYLNDAAKYYPNNWKCNPETDTFIRVSTGGRMNVCPRVATDLNVFELEDLTDKRWREQKRAGVADCGNCFFSGYFEVEQQHVLLDLTTVALAFIIRNGGVSFAEKLGKFAATITQTVLSE